VRRFQALGLQSALPDRHLVVASDGWDRPEPSRRAAARPRVRRAGREHDTNHLAALLFADEIETVLTQGGREAVRERLSGFSDAQRDVLRDTLADLAHA
jgi:hypothetical protein